MLIRDKYKNVYNLACCLYSDIPQTYCPMSISEAAICIIPDYYLMIICLTGHEQYELGHSFHAIARLIKCIVS